MKSFYSLITLAVFLVGSTSRVFPDETDHFRKFQVPPDEARILALTGVREFRCDYEINESNAKSFGINSPSNYQQDFCLFAELYSQGKCIGRYRLARATSLFKDPKLPLKGIISIGWNAKDHELISVIDNGQFYTPWSAFVILKDFQCMDDFFFENSEPEKRHSDESGDFELYPVVGICGERNTKISYIGVSNAAAFLKRCQEAHARFALMIYLYKASGGEDPSLSFNPSP